VNLGRQGEGTLERGIKAVRAPQASPVRPLVSVLAAAGHTAFPLKSPSPLRSNVPARRGGRRSGIRRPIAYIAAAGPSFIALLAVCIRISPAGLGSYNGVSYDGAHLPTLVPYAIALALTGSLLVLSARSLPAGDACRPTTVGSPGDTPPRRSRPSARAPRACAQGALRCSRSTPPGP
jgi:hypothetical protein